MPHTIILNIADLIVSLKTNSTYMAERLRQRYGDFLDDSQPAMVIVDCQVEDGLQFIEPQPNSEWIIELDYQGDEIAYTSYYERAVINTQSGTATVQAAPHADLENFLRVLYAWLCVQHESLLLHAAGVVRDGCGYVFFGPSGAGKSTTAGLSAASASVLSDDIVIIRRHDEGYFLYGVPFIGELGAGPRSNQHAPLQAIYRLHQDVSHRVAPLPRAIAVAELVASLPFVVQDSYWGQQAISICQQLTKQTPVAMLHFSRDPGFWREIHGHVA